MVSGQAYSGSGGEEMNIIDEYKRLYEDEAVAESKRDTAKRVYRRNLIATWPKGAKGTDYSEPRVMTSVHIPDTVEIEQSRQEYLFWKQELKAIQLQRRKLENKIESLRNKEKKIVMYKIQGLTAEQIAEKLEISVRWVYKVLQKINYNSSL